MDAPVLQSAADPAADGYAHNVKSNTALVLELRDRLAAARLGGPERARDRHTARGKLLPRDRVEELLDPSSAFLELSPLAADGMYGGDAPARRDHHRRRPGGRPGVCDRRQRRDGQGRHLLPDDREEAPARPGGRAAQPAAVHLPGRLRRRLPARAGRGVPRPRALRADLLQPGADVRRRHPADRRGARLVHRGRRVRAGDERRGGDRPQPGHDLPRRPAAGEGGDRRGGHRRGARRRRAALAGLRRHRPPGRRRPARAADRPLDRRHARAACAAAVGGAADRGARRTTRPSSTAWCRPTRAPPTTCAR